MSAEPRGQAILACEKLVGARLQLQLEFGLYSFEVTCFALQRASGGLRVDNVAWELRAVLPSTLPLLFLFSNDWLQRVSVRALTECCTAVRVARKVRKGFVCEVIFSCGECGRLLRDGVGPALERQLAKTISNPGRELKLAGEWYGQHFGALEGEIFAEDTLNEIEAVFAAEGQIKSLLKLPTTWYSRA